jgi:hypothetical protein
VTFPLGAAQAKDYFPSGSLPGKGTPLSNPADPSDQINPALDAVVRTRSGRAIRSGARHHSKQEQALELILSFQPRDAIDMTLAGQAMLFNELLANAARDVLRAAPGTPKSRGIASIIRMGRLVLGHLDRLREQRPPNYWPNVAVPIPAIEPPGAASPVVPETSWLDPPLEQWIIETQADIEWRSAPAPSHDDASAFSRQPSGYLPSRKLMEPATGRDPSARQPNIASDAKKF